MISYKHLFAKADLLVPENKFKECPGNYRNFLTPEDQELFVAMVAQTYQWDDGTPRTVRGQAEKPSESRCVQMVGNQSG